MKSSIVLIVCFGFVFSSPYEDQLFSQAVNAIQRGDLEALHRNFPHDVNTLTANGNTLLNLAIAQGNIEIVRLLIHYADVNKSGKSEDGIQQTPLDTAEKYNRGDIAHLLVNTNGIQLPFNDGKTYPQRSKLHWAAERGFESLAKLLIEKDGAHVNELINQATGTTLLHHIVSLNPSDKYLPIVKLLIEKGAIVNAPDTYGRTPIYYTIQPQKSDLTQLLINNKAALDRKDVQGKSPLRAAIDDGAVDVVRVMLSANRAIVDAPDTSGRTPIYYTTYPNKAVLTKLLIDNNASVNVTDSGGKSPLHTAVENGALDEARLLINKQANVNATIPSTGETALHLIAKSALDKDKARDIARALIKGGIGFDMRDKLNKTAADLVDSTKPENAEFIEILKGNHALALCANIILILFLLCSTLMGDRL